MLKSNNVDTRYGKSENACANTRLERKILITLDFENGFLPTYLPQWDPCALQFVEIWTRPNMDVGFVHGLYLYSCLSLYAPLLLGIHIGKRKLWLVEIQKVLKKIAPKN